MDAQDEHFMRLAIQKAKEGVDEGQTTFGACIVKNVEIVTYDELLQRLKNQMAKIYTD